MPSLSKDLRNRLASRTLVARDTAEKAVRAAMENLAVHEAAPRPHMSAEQRDLRNRLRARGGAVGDEREANGGQRLDHLVGDAAYEHWHRLLFTRFLTENNLLRTDAANGYVPVSLAECEELAEEMGARNGFELACRFANQILPGVFRKDDPVLELRLAPNDEVALKILLDELPTEVFTADDSLGWTYQFWQAKRKQEVNDSGTKIGADELSPVTQLFTEHYMVDFLLHNTLGAWWAGKQGPNHAATEADARRNVALPERDGMPAVEWNYLRFVQDEESRTWRPAAGTFEGWPKKTREVTMLDPCMGSGHFLVFALPLIARLRMEEESLSAKDAVAASLRDNIHGLELDPRCTQIGAFNVALTAWKLAGYQQLPAPHIACSGLAPQAKLADWLKLAGDNEALQAGMKRLYELFEQAPVLGSLIDPRKGSGELFESNFDDLQPLLEQALADDKADEASHEMAVTAKGIAAAASLLSMRYTLVVTNVPYLGRLKQHSILRGFCTENYPQSKADLATCFVERCLELAIVGGTSALVAPQIWLFLKTYTFLRLSLLSSATWNFVAKLGTRAFDTIGGAVVNVNLQAITKRVPQQESEILGLDVGAEPSGQQKAAQLALAKCTLISQSVQIKNPNSTVVFELASGLSLLEDFADSIQGASTLDIEMFRIRFWEVEPGQEWILHQSTPRASVPYSGLEYVSIHRNAGGRFETLAQELKTEGRLGGAWSGQPVWGRIGVACAWMGSLPTAIYMGAVYDNSIAVIMPKVHKHLPAIWAFCSSSGYPLEVRKLNQKSQVANATLVQVPFDLAHWQKVAAEKYPNGLPKAHSDDSTQWLFNGHPKGGEQPLHVALARLLNYRWPRQTGSSYPDCPALGPDGLEQFADADGIVCLPPINQEQPAAARLRQVLGAALGNFDERALITTAGGKATNLEDWLRDEAFEQHCKLFHHRPFVWHIWDGRKDGFHAMVNYHQLDNATLQKLTYSYLGDWIRVQDEGAKADKPGAAERLGAAQALQKELAKILEGEAPYDLFVRWKPLAQQAIGWHPDINDGVRLNIRPFLNAMDVKQRGAGILRWKPNIKWDKDRGKEPQRDKAEYPWFWCEEEPGTDPSGKTFTGNRWNDVHLSLDKKRNANG